MRATLDLDRVCEVQRANRARFQAYLDRLALLTPDEFEEYLLRREQERRATCER